MLLRRRVQQGAWITASAGGGGIGRVLAGTAKRLADHAVVLHLSDLQLRGAHDGINTRVHEWSQGYGAIDRNAVLEVGNYAQVAAWERDLVDGDGYGQIPQQGILRAFENGSPIRIGQRDRADAGQERHRRDRTYVETTQIVLTAHVGALERGRHQASISRDERSLDTEPERVAAILHWSPVREGNDRPNRVNGAPNPRDLRSQGQRTAVVGRDLTIDGVHGEVGEDLAGDDAFQRIGPGNTAEGEEFEQVFGCRTQRQQCGAVQRIGNPDALERVAQGIAERTGESDARLRVVLQVLQHGVGQIQGLAAENGKLARLVIAYFVVVNVKAKLQRPVKHVRLRKAEADGAGEVPDAGLNLQRLTQAEEVVGGVVDAHERAFQPADASVQADAVLALFMDF